MSSKARMRPSWRKGQNRSGLPTPPGCKFMTIAQRHASERSIVGETATAVKRVAKRAAKAVTGTKVGGDPEFERDGGSLGSAHSA
jgi:hypothetical protein